MGNKVVKEFEFSPEFGFTGSAGQQTVRGYMRGGAVGKAKVGKVMSEFGAGELHSGSDKGPVVKNPKQAVAIALSAARKSGADIPMPTPNAPAVKAGGKPAFRHEPMIAPAGMRKGGKVGC